MAHKDSDAESDAHRPIDAATLLDRILREQAEVFDSHYAALRGGSDAAETTHKARVALRRMRSALDGFAPILGGDEARRLSRRARRLFRILGPLREADVAAETFGSDHDRDKMRARADECRAEARAALDKAGAGDFAADLAGLLDGGALIASRAPALRLARADSGLLGALALQRAWTEARVFGDSVAALDEEARHDFRKDMKTLRYLSEFFATSIPGKSPERFLSRMEDLQDDLGALNDIAVHAEGRPLDAALQRRADKAMAAAQGHWEKLRKLGPWWN